tara:strand:- start:1186 stop:2523 length:1338 start_codon:yes stop_codon:yes gene_type:complete
MGIEKSEGLYAGLSLVPNAEIESAVMNPEKFKQLYGLAYNALLSNAVLDATGPSGPTKSGFQQALDITNAETPSEIRDLYSNLAAAVSAVKATRTVYSSPPEKVYLTGNQWHPDVASLKVKAMGMKDYNSSDLILRYGNLYVGISLKKKPDPLKNNPTLINNALSTFLEGNQPLIDDLQEHRVKYFASVIQEACMAGGPLYGFATAETTGKSILELDPNNLQDALLLWNTKVPRKKNNKIVSESLINLKSKSELADAGGVLKKGNGSKKQNEFRDFVNKKLYNPNETLNPLWKGYLRIMNKKHIKETLAKSLLDKVLKLSLFDELEMSNWIGRDFAFHLVTGVGQVSTSLVPSVSEGKIQSLNSIMITVLKLSSQTTTLKVNKDRTFEGDGSRAKVIFTLFKGKTAILDVELRYKGDFKAYPQFFATMTSDFQDMVTGTAREWNV